MTLYKLITPWKFGGCLTLMMVCTFLLPNYAQVKGENKREIGGLATGGYKPYRQPPVPAINSEARSSQNSCFKNFAFTVKNYGYNKDGKFYSWGVAVKNGYSKAVQLKYKLLVGGEDPKNVPGTLTYYIKPGETYTNDFGLFKAIIVKSNSDDYKIEVSSVCFEGQDCSKNGYVQCGDDLKSKSFPVSKISLNGESEVPGTKSIALQDLKEFLPLTEGTTDKSLLSKVRKIFEAIGYKYLQMISTDRDITFSFDKAEVTIFEDGMDRGFSIDFANKIELLKFRQNNRDHLNGVKEADVPSLNRLVYFYETNQGRRKLRNEQ
ncbi:hypothetical protein [Daejeonella sp.]|uniref:hypothetical protein n=1 Tax=Daejeonella sp. TaxID=2805397 RepID=UPI0030BB5B59